MEKAALQNLREKINETIEALENISNRSHLFLHLIKSCPIPAWYKEYVDGKFYLVLVNPAFTRVTGITLPAYSGQHDSAVFSADDAQTFQHSDMEAVTRRRDILIEENATSPLTGAPIVWVGRKSPRFRDSAVIGVAGFAYPFPADLWNSLPPDTKDIFKSIKI